MLYTPVFNGLEVDINHKHFEIVSDPSSLEDVLVMGNESVLSGEKLTAVQDILLHPNSVTNSAVQVSLATNTFTFSDLQALFDHINLDDNSGQDIGHTIKVEFDISIKIDQYNHINHTMNIAPELFGYTEYPTISRRIAVDIDISNNSVFFDMEPPSYTYWSRPPYGNVGIFYHLMNPFNSHYFVLNTNSDGIEYIEQIDEPWWQSPDTYFLIGDPLFPTFHVKIEFWQFYKIGSSSYDINLDDDLYQMTHTLGSGDIWNATVLDMAYYLETLMIQYSHTHKENNPVFLNPLIVDEEKFYFKMSVTQTTTTGLTKTYTFNSHDLINGQYFHGTVSWPISWLQSYFKSPP
jgi:hypothetical protein